MISKWDIRFLRLAREVGTWSKDPSTQVGAVAVNPETKNVVSMGFNGFPRGVDDLEERLQDRETKYSMVVHAEMNVIYNASLNGASLKDSHVYVHGLPVCSSCCKGIIQSGVKKVFFCYNNSRENVEKWVDDFKISQMMFDEAGIEWKLVEMSELDENN